MNKNNQGIALVQVLIIVMILSIFGLYLSQSLKGQVSTAFDVQSAFQHRIVIEDAKAKLIHALLTENKSGKGSQEGSIAKQWNFYGKPFVMNGNVKVSLQDLRSLISLNITDKVLTAAVLGNLGMKRAQQEEFMDALADWKDKDELRRLNGAETSYYNSKQLNGPRNGYLQSLSEVGYIKSSEGIRFEQWEQYFSIQFVSDFNPLNAPKLILQAFLKDNAEVDEVIKLRENKSLNQLSFFQLTGIDEDEFISFSTGSSFRVSMQLIEKGYRINHQFTIEVKPTSLTQPVTIKNVTWNRE